MRTTSVSPGSAPLIAIGPTSPGQGASFPANQSDQRVFVTSVSPGFRVSTGSRAAYVWTPLTGLKRTTSAAAETGSAPKTTMIMIDPSHSSAFMRPLLDGRYLLLEMVSPRRAPVKPGDRRPAAKANYGSRGVCGFVRFDRTP